MMILIHNRSVQSFSPRTPLLRLFPSIAIRVRILGCSVETLPSFRVVPFIALIGQSHYALQYSGPSPDGDMTQYLKILFYMHSR